MMRSADSGGGRAHLAFLVLFGLAGWGLLLAATYVPGLGPGEVSSPGAVPFALFFVVILGTRVMAFRLLPETVVSLDSGFYIAAAICLGPVTAGRLVALALTLDSLFRLLGHGAGGRRAAGHGPEGLTYVLYFGGMTGALLMAVGWLFGVDASPLHRSGAEVVELEVVGLVFGLGGVLLAAHYTLQGIRLRLLGQSLRGYLRRMAVPGILAEASLLPLAVVVVLLYRPEQPLGFVLLGATYLLINFVFSRLSKTGAELRRRVGELETLNATARGLASSLQIHDLVESVARETLRALPSAEVLTLSHRLASDSGKRTELVVDSFDRERRRFERFHIDEEGVSGWVMKHNQPLVIADLAASEVGASLYGRSGVRSWLGVPILIYGEVEGVLAIQSHAADAFGDDDRHLLEAIGAQAAVALQNARLYEMAMVDGLTGLFVRRYLDARMEEEIQRSRRFGSEFSVVMMDIDDFKVLNDTHGHTAGDVILKQVAAIVKRQMRGVDTAARYGGEEFAIILPGTGMVDAYNQAERIRAEIADHRLQLGGKVLNVTASFGIAAYPESGEGDAEAVVRRADTALYRAKKTGKNRVELYWAEGSEARPRMRTV